MTLNYETSLKLKEIGVEQRGDDGWYCSDCQEEFINTKLYRHDFKTCQCEDWATKPSFLARDNNVAILSLSQLLEWLEGKEISLNFKYDHINKRWGAFNGVGQRMMKSYGFSKLLADIIIELDGSSK